MDSKRNSFFYENELEEGGMVFYLGFLVEMTGEVDSLVRRNLSRIDPFLPMFFFVPLSLFSPVYTYRRNKFRKEYFVKSYPWRAASSLLRSEYHIHHL